MRRVLLDPAALVAAAVAVDAAARAHHGTRVALIGGLAMQHYGSDRLTADVDFVVDRLLPGLKHVGFLSFGGEAVEAPNGVPVDLVLRDDDYQALYAEALDHATRFGEVLPGTDVRIVAPAYLAAMKMVAGRGKDEADLLWLVTSGRINTADTRKIIRKHLGPYGADEFDSQVSLAAFTAAREQ